MSSWSVLPWRKRWTKHLHSRDLHWLWDGINLRDLPCRSVLCVKAHDWLNRQPILFSLIVVDRDPERLCQSVSCVKVHDWLNQQPILFSLIIVDRDPERLYQSVSCVRAQDWLKQQLIIIFFLRIVELEFTLKFTVVGCFYKQPFSPICEICDIPDFTSQVFTVSRSASPLATRPRWWPHVQRVTTAQMAPDITGRPVQLVAIATGQVWVRPLNAHLAPRDTTAKVRASFLQTSKCWPKTDYVDFLKWEVGGARDVFEGDSVAGPGVALGVRPGAFEKRSTHTEYLMTLFVVQESIWPNRLPYATLATTVPRVSIDPTL